MKKPLARLVRATVLLVATVGATAAPAAADTLYPSSTSSTPVATGTTATAVGANVDVIDGPILITCSSVTWNLTVTSNTGTISADITGSTYSGCVVAGFFPATLSPNNSPAWVLSTSATSAPYASQLTGVDITMAGTSFTGDLVDASLGGTGTVEWLNAPARVNFDDAGTLYDTSSNPAYSTGTYEFQGTAADWDIR
jgi:hypothetical protein